MIRWLLMFVFCAGVAAAQQARLNVEVSSDNTMVGQPVTVRVTVLVPTFMPKPPVFPDIEVPGVLVRLPERASSPTSDRIDGETWSGITRSYRMYPLGPGNVSLPQQELTVTYAEGGPDDVVTEVLDFPAVSFTATVPDAAKDLSPLIIASGFSLEETVTGTEGLIVGGAVERMLTAKIEGTTPILIPALTPSQDVPGLRAYPDEPSVTVQENRGDISGQRSERVVYVPTAPGEATLPAIGFDWYNLDSKKVERAELPAHDVTIGENPNATAPLERSSGALRWVAWLLGALVVVAAGWFWGRASLVQLIGHWRARWEASEYHAHQGVRRAIRQKDLTQVMAALALWQARVGVMQPETRARLNQSLAAIGATKYGRERMSAGQAWIGAMDAYMAARREVRSAPTARALPALNPLSGPGS